ncbi:hypothetical protein QM467_06010 [Rhodoblastus sp. 17X3]|uniref:hypothetical protein n=1 Tax=Rhodoblastus sp. 17X3 TaxID=3047026 RepID=UPI0024B6EECD|nr:hypothetical protein [Rhodoblastus sp. 17X3]MDI9847615.1 hypothetical protein [Rhodoblastus sp. 17X3]
MGRFILQFEDQSRPLRVERDLVASFGYIVRTTATIIALGCVISVGSSYVTGDQKFLFRLIQLV